MALPIFFCVMCIVMSTPVANGMLMPSYQLYSREIPPEKQAIAQKTKIIDQLALLPTVLVKIIVAYTPNIPLKQLAYYMKDHPPRCMLAKVEYPFSSLCDDRYTNARHDDYYLITKHNDSSLQTTLCNCCPCQSTTKKTDTMTAFEQKHHVSVTSIRLMSKLLSMHAAYLCSARVAGDYMTSSSNSRAIFLDDDVTLPEIGRYMSWLYNILEPVLRSSIQQKSYEYELCNSYCRYYQGSNVPKVLMREKRFSPDLVPILYTCTPQKRFPLSIYIAPRLQHIRPQQITTPSRKRKALTL